MIYEDGLSLYSAEILCTNYIYFWQTGHLNKWSAELHSKFRNNGSIYTKGYSQLGVY